MSVKRDIEKNRLLKELDLSEEELTEEELRSLNDIIDNPYYSEATKKEKLKELKGGDDMDTVTVEGSKSQVKKLRVEIDGLRQEAVKLQQSPVNQIAPRNIQLCIDHLEDAKMRLGKVLEDLGSELPKEFADRKE